MTSADSCLYPKGIGERSRQDRLRYLRCLDGNNETVVNWKSRNVVPKRQDLNCRENNFTFPVL